MQKPIGGEVCFGGWWLCVEGNLIGAFFHTLNHARSAWGYVELVERNSFPTLKQA
jgi:hypothetical protein